jgi:uncharacterized protein (TIGR02757 family)
MVADAADQGPEAARLGALRIRPHLDALLAGLDNQRHLAADPLAFVYRFASPQDREVIAFFAALLAYGRVDLIRRALTDVVARVGPTPAATAAAEDLPAARQRFDGFVYRLTRGEDLARLWAGIGHLLRRHGSLLAAFQAGDDGQGDLRAALTRFHRAFNEPLAAEAPRQAYKHLLPDPAGPSPVKRLNLLLRWLVRGPDAIDLGLWRVLGPRAAHHPPRHPRPPHQPLPGAHRTHPGRSPHRGRDHHRPAGPRPGRSAALRLRPGPPGHQRRLPQPPGRGHLRVLPPRAHLPPRRRGAAAALSVG